MFIFCRKYSEISTLDAKCTITPPPTTTMMMIIIIIIIIINSNNITTNKLPEQVFIKTALLLLKIMTASWNLTIKKDIRKITSSIAVNDTHHFTLGDKLKHSDGTEKTGNRTTEFLAVVEACKAIF